MRPVAKPSLVLTATLIASLIATFGFLMVTALGVFMVAADSRAGNGGGGLVAAAVGYQALLIALPIAGLILMNRRRRIAVILQWTWVLTALPLILTVSVLVVRSSIPPHY
jgi:hypothetical protein